MAAVGEATARPDWPDLLRLEGFGAVYYHRPRAATYLYPQHLAQLLAAARERSVLEVYLQQRAVLPLPESVFAREVAHWRRLGLLDEGYRLRARLLDGRGAGATLSAPLVTHVQVTGACNLSCSHCYVPVTPRPAPGEMDTAALRALLLELGAIGCPVVVLAGGEPLRRPDLFEILEVLPRAQLDVWLCTNATLLDRDKAERLAASGLRGLQVSLDGPDAATHDFLRGPGQFARALRGVRHALAAGIPEVKLRATVTAHNKDRLAEFAPLAAELGVHRVAFKPFDLVGVASGAHELYIDRRSYFEAIERARTAWPADGVPADFSDGMPTRPPDWTRLIPAFGCVGGTTSATVLPDGRVVACGVFTSEDDCRLGEHTFAECWLGSRAIERWRRLAGNAQCRSCANFGLCGGGCRARAVAAGRGFEDPDPWAPCSMWQPAPPAPPLRAPRPGAPALPPPAAPSRLRAGLRAGGGARRLPMAGRG
ncbi:MAG: hypothetical protein KatS3mg102_0596 [Planctomycetota bacterium]|nr:MAG: hypothetical protein KatS3mg102_0596 [Planctomycetota bacterium]